MFIQVLLLLILMKAKETNARIIIDKMLLEAEWKLPGWFKDNEINVETEITNEFGEADYVLLSSKEDHLCTVEAKNHSKSPLTGKEQARDYANALKCRFIILSNGISHYLWDLKQGNPFLIEKFPTQEELERQARAAQEAAEAAQRETERVARETQDALNRAAEDAKKSKWNPKNWF